MFIKREWATPVVIGSLLLSGVTGITMFFEAGTFLGNRVHQFLGLVFVLGGLAHITVNFPSFKRHLKETGGRIIVGLYALILVLTFLPIGPQKTGGEDQLRFFISAALNAPVGDVARMVKRDPADVVAQLKAAGYNISDPGQSLNSANPNPAEPFRALNALNLIMSRVPKPPPPR